jgi:hypothetical protein
VPILREPAAFILREFRIPASRHNTTLLYPNTAFGVASIQNPISTLSLRSSPGCHLSTTRVSLRSDSNRSHWNPPVSWEPAGFVGRCLEIRKLTQSHHQARGFLDASSRVTPKPDSQINVKRLECSDCEVFVRQIATLINLEDSSRGKSSQNLALGQIRSKFR